jgi:endonuclease/exonuclease/phosphatase family metal-dependent hydrolase
MELKILSWNIWIDGHFDEIKDFLQRAGADIIGLQEVKSDDPKRDVIGFLSELGYNHVFAPVKKLWGENVYHDGPAIFSKFPIDSSEVFDLSADDHRVVVRADIEIRKTTLHVFSTHLVHTHQKKSDVQESQARNLLKILPKEKTIVMGDFNATPESATIQIMESELANTDPSASPTWSVYLEGCTVCNPQKIETRLDYIFASKDLRTSSPKVESSKASDHLPISVLLIV